MRQHLSMITLGVNDVKQSANFFQNVLGWSPSKKSSDDLIMFSLGGIFLALYPIDELAADAGLNYEKQSFSGITLSHNAKSIEEVDEIFEQLKKHNCKIVKSPQQVFWGGYSGYFSDPNGYLFEVAFNPFWQLDENGNIVDEK